MEQIRQLTSNTISSARLVMHPVITLVGVFKAVVVARSLYNFFTRFVVKKIIGFDEKALKDKEWILVTGATSGIGRSIVTELVRLNKGIVAVGRNQDKLDELEAYFRSVGHNKFKLLRIDLSDLETISIEADRWEKVFAGLPDIDLVINNAGVSPKQRVLVTQYKDIVEAFNTNVMSLLFISNGYLKQKMNTNIDKGHLAFVSSGYAKLPVPYSSCYPMTKNFGSLYYSALNEKLRKTGSSVKVTNIFLGRVITPMNIVMYNDYHSSQSESRKKLSFSVLLPETAAKAILFQSLNEVESYGHPNHYIFSAIGESLYGLFGNILLKPIAKAKLKYLLEREKEAEKQQRD